MSIKKRKEERFAPVAESLLLSALGGWEGTNAIDPDEDNVADFR